MMDDPILKTVLATLRQEALRVGSDLIEDGLNVVEARIKGEATEDELWRWLRRAQEPSSGPEGAA